MTDVPAADVAPVVRAADVRLPPEDAFRIFTSEIGAWWPLPSHGIFGSDAGGVIFRDGHVVELATDGREAIWAEVLAWEPPHRFVLAWHPGRESSEASQVEVAFESQADGRSTRVVIEHRGWGAFGADAVQRRRSYVGPNAWGYVLDHFADGAEVRASESDLAELRAAYDTFFVEAETGGFGDAPGGEWDAAQVVAHVALNDAAMVSVCQALVHGEATRFENQVCQDEAVLADFIERIGDMDGLIRHGRAMATLVIASVGRLSDDQRSTLVHCHLTHDGAVMVDEPMPWQMVAATIQATRHLPAHVEQLRNLR